MLNRRPRRLILSGAYTFVPALSGSMSHLAFSAPTRDAVHAFLDAAVADGAEVLHQPRVWPAYHESYYGAFVRDPDGNNVEAVCHVPPS